MKVSASTVKRVLDDYGIVPNPEQKKRIDWERFISSHIDSLAATDFFTVEVMTPTDWAVCCAPTGGFQGYRRLHSNYETLP